MPIFGLWFCPTGRGGQQHFCKAANFPVSKLNLPKHALFACIWACHNLGLVCFPCVAQRKWNLYLLGGGWGVNNPPPSLSWWGAATLPPPLPVLLGANFRTKSSWQAAGHRVNITAPLPGLTSRSIGSQQWRHNLQSLLTTTSNFLEGYWIHFTLNIFDWSKSLVRERRKAMHHPLQEQAKIAENPWLEAPVHSTSPPSPIGWRFDNFHLPERKCSLLGWKGKKQKKRLCTTGECIKHWSKPKKMPCKRICTSTIQKIKHPTKIISDRGFTINGIPRGGLLWR